MNWNIYENKLNNKYVVFVVKPSNYKLTLILKFKIISNIAYV